MSTGTKCKKRPEAKLTVVTTRSQRVTGLAMRFFGRAPFQESCYHANRAVMCLTISFAPPRYHISALTMVQLSEEKHPREGPMSLVQLCALVAQPSKAQAKARSQSQAKARSQSQAKARSQSQRDERKEQLRAQLFWNDIQHPEHMILSSLEKLLRQAV
jgi:hypothetical protein